MLLLKQKQQSTCPCRCLSLLCFVAKQLCTSVLCTGFDSLASTFTCSSQTVERLRLEVVMEALPEDATTGSGAEETATKGKKPQKQRKRKMTATGGQNMWCVERDI